MLVKADVSQPIAFASVLGVLFLYRMGTHYWRAAGGCPQVQIRSGRFGTSTVEDLDRAAAGRSDFDETPEVRTFRLASVGEPRLPFDFLPGQYLNLTLGIDGQKVRRSYTIASSPTRIGCCEVTVKREEHGLASRHLHDSVRVGDLFDVLAPAGRFTFTGAKSDRIVLIAGGVGITPLMSQIRYLTDTSWPGDIHLVFSVKTERDIIFREELAALGGPTQICTLRSLSLAMTRPPHPTLSPLGERVGGGVESEAGSLRPCWPAPCRRFVPAESTSAVRPR